MSALHAGNKKKEEKERIYKQVRETVLELKRSASQDFEGIYAPMENAEDAKKFTPGPIALVEDIRAIQRCEFYILYYPKAPYQSSVLVEVGYAIAAKKNILIFTKSRKDLPFLLRNADSRIGNLRIVDDEEWSQGGSSIIDYWNTKRKFLLKFERL